MDIRVTDERLAELPKNKGGRPPKGSGMHVNHDGYLRIHRGPLRFQMAHRAYVNRQMQQSLGRDLRATEEVHHLCRNRACWPPTDGHLIIMDQALHHAIDGGRMPWYKKRARD